MPDTDQPMLIIIASYSGAGPEDIDELVTQPIEDQVGTIEGVEKHELHFQREQGHDYAGI